MIVPILAWSALGIAFLWAVTLVVNRRSREARLARVRTGWGQPPARDRDMAAISGYHRARAAASPGETLDDRTWDDLNMDDVFAVVDRTESAVGQQVLYARLRTAPRGSHLAAFESLVTRMSSDAGAREQAQLVLMGLRGPAALDIWSLAQPGTLEITPWHVLFPVAGVTLAMAIAVVPFWPPAVLFLMVGAVCSLIVRASVATSLRTVAGAFRQVGPLVDAAQHLVTLNTDSASDLLGALRTDTERLARLRRIASWAGRDSSSAVAGDLPGLIFEYLNMILWLDANALYFGARELRARAPELLRVLSAVGDVDAAISVASYRAGTPGWIRPNLIANGPAVITDVRHPLLPDAVPNSIGLLPPNGLIITGSNMSGKTTFLRTIGVTAVLAQTINTCVAAAYEAPVFCVRSCIGRTDDLTAGKSYYLVEVESVLALVHAARGHVPHLMIFDELFRGTNAVERIAAAEAVLRGLLAPVDDAGRSPHVVLVATHDQELVDLLDGVYAAHHFSDTIDESGLSFDYVLKPGAATTRNAIALLAQRGAPPEMVEQALKRAAALDRARPAVLSGGAG